MRSTRLLVAGLTILGVAGCATSAPGWTYTPASAGTYQFVCDVHANMVGTLTAG